ncbi:MAG TPA: hypothetical protein VG676_08600 [Chitinophagaceae bacterium]|nr:hypothetical protein [Chitinophagaceae bacterium]
MKKKKGRHYGGPSLRNPKVLIEQKKYFNHKNSASIMPLSCSPLR